MVDFEELFLRIYPDPVLREKSRPVKKVSRKILRIVEEMFRIMDEKQGLGLAAQQAGRTEAIIVLNVPIDDKEVFREALINPKITKFSKEQITQEEGCLSFPNVYFPVTRSERVECEALNLGGKPVKIKAHGLLARAIQHEVDHLNGILFIDYLDEEERKKIENHFLWNRI